MDVNVGRGITLAVDADRLSADVMKHVVYIGLRNILMDAHANATKKSGAGPDEARALSEKKLDAMYRGEVRTTTHRAGDEIAREVLKIAVERVKARIAELGKKLGDYDVKKLAADLAAKNADEFRELAESRLADVKAVGVGLDEIGL